MPTICLQGSDLTYDEKDVIQFDEGLIGMPYLRRLSLLARPDVAPLLLLCSLDNPHISFLVLDACSHFPDYAPKLPAQLQAQLGLQAEEKPLILVTVTIAPEWQKSTLNLRAPIIVAAGTMRGAQVVLTDSKYQLAEPLPSTWTTAAV